MKYQDVLSTAAKIPALRQASYGDPADTYDRAATIATAILGKAITARDVAMILHAIKLARIRTDVANADNYFDGINYLAIAAELTHFTAPPIVGVDLARPGSDKTIFNNLGPLMRTDDPVLRNPQPRFAKPAPGDFDDGGNLSKGDEA